MKKYFNKFIITSSSFMALALPIGAVISCSKTGDLEKKTKVMDESAEFANLVAKFDGKLNTDDQLEIVFNKIEVKDKFETYVKAFNKVFKTKLKAVVVGGQQSIDTVTATKFAATSHNILLTAASSPKHFSDNPTRYLSTRASEMLDVEDLDDAGAIEFGTDKTSMSAASEGFGLIYNKTKFKEMGITVNEGKDSPVDTPTPLDGVYEDEDNKLEVFTNDLTDGGFTELEEFIKEKNIRPFYPLSKANEGNIWPMTNHLVGVAINQNVNPSKYDSKVFEDIYNPKMIGAVNNALKHYGHNEDYNKATNTVDKSIAEVSIGQTAMVQNGTWNNQALIENNKDAKFGLIPMPVFDDRNNNAVITKSYSSWWAITDITKENEKNQNTAKAFLQSLYKTKLGIETIINDFSFNIPFLASELGITEQIDFSGNQLFASLNNYSKDHTGSSDDQLVEGILNNNNEAMRKWINKGAPKSGPEYKALKKAWGEVINKDAKS